MKLLVHLLELVKGDITVILGMRYQELVKRRVSMRVTAENAPNAIFFLF